jgi:hypothetical protein
MNRLQQLERMMPSLWIDTPDRPFDDFVARFWHGEYHPSVTALEIIRRHTIYWPDLSQDRSR